LQRRIAGACLCGAESGCRWLPVVEPTQTQVFRTRAMERDVGALQMRVVLFERKHGCIADVAPGL
jgi:hypothetical protein